MRKKISDHPKWDGRIMHFITHEYSDLSKTPQGTAAVVNSMRKKGFDNNRSRQCVFSGSIFRIHWPEIGKDDSSNSKMELLQQEQLHRLLQEPNDQHHYQPLQDGQDSLQDQAVIFYLKSKRGSST